MTDNPLAAIAEGVKLVPWLQNATSHEGITTVKMASDEVKIIIAALTAAGEMAGERPTSAQASVCNEILRIMETYHRQEDEQGYIGTPGGLEHMGDVWSLFKDWETQLSAAPASPVGEDVVEKVARAICRENCAFIGEKPCFEIEDTWPNPNCQEPGCHSQARAALAAIGRT